MNILDVPRQSPLLYATAYGHTACVQLLLDSGADPNLANERVSPLHAAAFEGETDLQWFPVITFLSFLCRPTVYYYYYYCLKCKNNCCTFVGSLAKSVLF